MSASTEQAVRIYFDALGTADAEAFVALFSSDVRFTDPVGQTTLEGQEGVARFHKGLRRAWSELSMVPVAVHVRGSAAAAQWAARGRSTSGNDIAFEGINVFEVDDEGRITRVDGYWDFEGVIAQM